jgi:hypothetical protein
VSARAKTSEGESFQNKAEGIRVRCLDSPCKEVKVEDDEEDGKDQEEQVRSERRNVRE